MTLNVIAILSPGDMGSAVGRALKEHGHDVITCLAGRSAASKSRAERAGFRIVATLEALVRESDAVLAILPPEAALATAREVAHAMRRENAKPIYADCNAIAPQTAQAIAAEIEVVGAPFVDCSIIGQAPGKSDQPVRFYVSGAQAVRLRELRGKDIDVRPAGAEIGRASAIKMCYAAVTKGFNTLNTAALIAAESLGVGAELRAEFKYSRPDIWRAMENQVSRLPADSGRWIGEMTEIARTFESAGVTPQFHLGARWVFELLSGTPFAAETRETIDKSRTLEQSIAVYANHLTRKEAAE